MDLSILVHVLVLRHPLGARSADRFRAGRERTAVPAGVSSGAAHHRGAAHGAWYRQLPALGGPFVHPGRPTAQHRRDRRSHLPLCPCSRRAHSRRTRSLQRGGQHDLLGHVWCGAGGCSGPRAHRDQGDAGAWFRSGILGRRERGLGHYWSHHSAERHHGDLRPLGAGLGWRPVPRRHSAGCPHGLLAHGDDLFSRRHGPHQGAGRAEGFVQRGQRELSRRVARVPCARHARGRTDPWRGHTDRAWRIDRRLRCGAGLLVSAS